MKKQKKYQKSTLLKVLETMCGILFAIALMLLIWDIQLKNNTVNNSGENFTPATPYGEETGAPALRIDRNATEKRTKEQEETDKNVAIPGFKTMTIPAGKERVSVDFYNPENNSGYYYLSFELRVPDVNGNYETLYTSDLVEAGKHLYQIVLNHALSAGIYEHSVLHIQPYKVDDFAPTNNADVEFILKVE